MSIALKEIPPTAGLPISLQDLVLALRTPYIEGDFEKAIAKFLGFERVLLTSSGTAGLVVALSVLKEITGKTQVIVSAFTCPLVALACMQAGVDIVLCDTDANSFQLSTDRLGQLINENTLAIIATHMGGLGDNIIAISKIAKQYNAYVIEDVAQSLGLKINGQPAGTIGDIAIFSLAVGKGLTMYDGGFVAAKSHELQDRLEKKFEDMRDSHSFVNFIKNIELIAYGLIYRPSLLPFAYGLPLRANLKAGNLLAVLGEEFSLPIEIYRPSIFRRRVAWQSMANLEKFLDDNRGRAKQRIERLQELDGLVVLDEREFEHGSFPFLTLLAPDCAYRDRIMSKLWTSGLGVTRLFLSTLGEYPYLKDYIQGCKSRHLNLLASTLTNAEDFADRHFTISNSKMLDDSGFERIIRVLRGVE